MPEIHDVGKLLDKESLKNILSINLIGHCLKVKENGEEKKLDFERIGFPKPLSGNWIAIHKHMRSKFTDEDGDIGFLSIADKVAASHRALGKADQEELKKPKTESPIKINKLWRSWTEDAQFISSKEDFRKLFDFIERCDSSTVFLNSKYKEYLIKYPEDKSRPLNITSLYSHSLITGKVFRFLRKTFMNKSFTGPKDALNGWKVKLIKCHVGIPQFLTKTKDLSIFRLLEEKLQEIESCDNVLFRAGTEFLMILSVDEELEKNQIIDSFTSTGLIVTTDEVITNLGNAYPTPLAIKKRNMGENKSSKLIFCSQNYYPNLQGSFKQPICEICQLEPAKFLNELNQEEKQLVYDEKSGLVENLGNRCLSIRNQYKPLLKLADWTNDEDIKVAWVKISLNLERLNKTLFDLYKKYIKECNVDSIIKESEVRFSTLKEFSLDYQSFIEEIGEDFKNVFEQQNFELILPDMFCLRLRSGNEIYKIIDIFCQKITDKKWFDKLPSSSSPVMIGVSCSKVKYPFNNHWQFLSAIEEMETINIQLPFRASTLLSIEKYNLLKEKLNLKTNRRGASLLHKLAMIQEKTENELLVKIEIIERRRDLGEIYDSFVRGEFTANELLSYYKIFGG